ncbi:helix-turn-helix domain-containing protein [Corynebacterium halotolerans]|uniref:HTH-type transcriptional regulator n=1 Tax=Corynebacterium halotolerans YIM 70093 = DSM 44683 TaxID=1121362 RepID=M1MVB0_9CORY|nr:helix-turn-helix transcriptional regulator [Corynebacterium halotolerans]AGF71659.1 HTH-type transcriptional regulator [Corynebacterium halotolerans YIM 70093 = DSM 44683]
MGRRSEWRRWASYGHCLGENLRVLRTMRGLSQDRLAELSGLSRNQISNIERNENTSTRSTDPVLSTVYKLARALHVPPVALLPAGDRFVEDICPAEGLGVDIVWPARPEDTMAFDVHHLYSARPGDRPGFDPTRALELDAPVPGSRGHSAGELPPQDVSAAGEDPDADDHDGRAGDPAEEGQ